MRVAILAQKEKHCQKRSLKSEQYYKVGLVQGSANTPMNFVVRGA